MPQTLSPLWKARFLPLPADVECGDVVDATGALYTSGADAFVVMSEFVMLALIKLSTSYALRRVALLSASNRTTSPLLMAHTMPL
jgi:hypothetical protein